MRIWKIICLVVAMAAGIAPAYAQTSAERIAAFMQSQQDVPFFNGGVLVVEGGNVVYRKAMGLGDFGAHTPLDVDAVFQTASMSKPFTSTAILQLRDARRLKLDDSVAKYLAGFPFPEITIRHLLTHTSGLPDLELFEAMAAAQPGKVIGGVDLIPALEAWKDGLAFKPGERFQYSNTNYQLLARIVETVSGKPFATYLRENIFRPTGMTSSYALGGAAVGATRRPVINHILPTMYDTTPSDVRGVHTGDARRMHQLAYETVTMGSTLGDQNVFTTLDDLAKFDAALRSNRILSAASQREAYTPVKLNDGTTYLDGEVYTIYGVKCSYGMGWEVCDHPEFGRIVGHAGYNQGIQTILYRNLDRGQVIAMFDNAESGDFAPKVASVANLLNGKPALEIARQRSLARAFGEVLVRDGVGAGLVFFNQHRGETQDWVFTSQGVNRLGYDLLRNGKIGLAVEVFKLNVIMNPQHAGFLDSLGEGLVAAGQTRDAIAAYRQSLALEPKNDSGRAKLEQLLAAPG